jgi:hypothetical protein
VANKDVKEFRTKTLPFYNDLHEIFTGAIAVGSFARSSAQEIPFTSLDDCNDTEGIESASYNAEPDDGVGEVDNGCDTCDTPTFL